MSGRALPHMGTLVSTLFAFGAHADVSPFLGCGSPLYSIAITFSKSLTLLLILCWPWFPRLPCIKLWMHYHELCLPYWALCQPPWGCVFNHIAWSCLMSSHAEPFLYPSHLVSLFYREGIFPRMPISYTCILALSIGVDVYLTSECIHLCILCIVTQCLFRDVSIM